MPPKAKKEEPKTKCITLQILRVTIDKGGYATGGGGIPKGRYFGTGAPLWHAQLDDYSSDVDSEYIHRTFLTENKSVIRAQNKDAAKAVFANMFTPYGFTVKCK